MGKQAHGTVPGVIPMGVKQKNRSERHHLQNHHRRRFEGHAKSALSMRAMSARTVHSICNIVARIWGACSTPSHARDDHLARNPSHAPRAARGACGLLLAGPLVLRLPPSSALGLLSMMLSFDGCCNVVGSGLVIVWVPVETCEDGCFYANGARL
jgi:hypothetical protein